jgi:hypothetical protein
LREELFIKTVRVALTVAMMIGDTGDWCQVDAEVGDEDWEFRFELDSDV